VDELPELRSDQDVDALMARLRAKLGTNGSPAAEPQPASEPSSNPWSDFLAAQGEFTATMLRAVQVLADAVDELQQETPEPLVKAAAARVTGDAAAKRPRKAPRRSRR
jgi:hypothetical protein